MNRRNELEVRTMKRMILFIGITAAALGLSDPQPARAHGIHNPAPQATQHSTKPGVIHKSHYRRHHHWRFQRWGYRHPRYHRPRFYRPRYHRPWPHRYAPRGYWYGGYYYPPIRAAFSLRYSGYRHQLYKKRH